MQRTHESYDAVADLPEAALRDLLAVGDAPERVWAAWALAVRIGRPVASQLARSLPREPDPGVRRRLIITLTGFGEVAAVCTLARLDPDARVRATACQYVGRLASADPSLWDALEDGLSDEAAVVRETIISTLPAEAPAGLREACLARIDDSSTDVRKAIADGLDDLLVAGAELPLRARAQALSEPEPDVRLPLLAAWLDRGGAASFLDGVAGAAPHVAGEALSLVIDRGVRIEWADVARFADKATGDLAERVFEHFLQRLEELPLGWLLAHLSGPGAARAASWQVIAHLSPRLHALAPADLGVQEVRALRAVGEKLARALENASDDWDDSESWEDGEWQEEAAAWRAEAEALAAEIRRLSSLRSV